MASTHDPAHPVPITGTQEGIAQQTYAHTTDEKSPYEEKTCEENDQSSGDIEIVAIEQDGDVIRESGMPLNQFKQYITTPLVLESIERLPSRIGTAVVTPCC